MKAGVTMVWVVPTDYGPTSVEGESCARVLDGGGDSSPRPGQLLSEELSNGKLRQGTGWSVRLQPKARPAAEQKALTCFLMAVQTPCVKNAQTSPWWLTAPRSCAGALTLFQHVFDYAVGG